MLNQNFCIIRVSYKSQTNEFRAGIDASPRTIFVAFKQAKNLDLDEDEFYFYSRRVIPIDSTSIRSFVNLQTVNDWRLIKKTEYAKLDQFLQRMMPSIISECAGLNQASTALVHSINSMRTDILNFSSDEVSSSVLSLVPFERLKDLEGDALVKELVKWFKEDFFTFVKSLPCHVCNSPTQRLPGLGVVSETEAKHLATHAELYKCPNCGAITRFPRYNDVLELIKTRKGRCGEFTNTFGAFLKCLQFDIRLVTDMNDHIWVEYWSDEQQRYIHVDPCENIVDAPYTYEVGWGKQHTWVIAIGEFQCVDVTKKYTRNLDDCIQRRNKLCSDDWYLKYMKLKNDEYLCGCDQEMKEEIIEKQQKDLASLENPRTEIHPEEQRKRISGNE